MTNNSWEKNHNLIFIWSISESMGSLSIKLSKYTYWQLNKQSNELQIYWSNITLQIPLFYPLVLSLLVFRQTLSPSLVRILCMKSTYKQKIVIFHAGYRLCLLIHIHQFNMIWENLVLGKDFSCFKPHTTTQKCFPVCRLALETTPPWTFEKLPSITTSIWTVNIQVTI